ncbi:MAG: hypothetical protein SZ59_C0001G0080 [candidate division TM6 bacterium GW2011_GWF2_28_16]|nr:MAG: hypothetical protein SZ59_C0001G0080 [candidate division TM6 bacterium GW2011_GWF2_28_16]
MFLKKAFLLLELTIAISIFVIFVLIFLNFFNIAIFTQNLGNRTGNILNNISNYIESYKYHEQQAFGQDNSLNNIKLKYYKINLDNKNNYFEFIKVKSKEPVNLKKMCKLTLVGPCY